MFGSVKSIAFAAGVSVAALSTAAFAQEAPVGFSDVQVTASLSAAEDGNALTIFPEIEDDLRGAISALIPGSDDASDPVINVDVRQIALNGNPLVTSTEGFNEIQGVVSISDTNNNVGAQSFEVNVAAYPADQAVPEGYIAVQPSTDDFYNVMVNSFAEVVAEQAAELNTANVNRDK